MRRNTRARWIGVVARRAFQAVASTVLIGVLCFFMVRSLPGDMAVRIAAGRYGYDLVGNGAADAVRAELGLDRPLASALLAWLGDLAHLDLGRSMVSGEPVLAEVAYHLGATIELSIAALAFGVAIGLPVGCRAALHAGGWVDRTTVAWAVLGRGLPPFLVALLLMLVVAVGMGALPVAGDETASSLLLPALTLGIILSAGLARVVRNALRDALLSPSFEFARTKGLSDFDALLRHGVRNAALPVVAYLGFQAVFLVEGAIVVETVFAWPGIGHALVHAVFGRDVPLIQGTALCMGLLFVTFNTLVDALSLAIDPRPRAHAPR